MEAIDVHVHMVPPRFVDLVRGEALRAIVDVERTVIGATLARLLGAG